MPATSHRGSRQKGAPDYESFRLRRFVERLAQQGELVYCDEALQLIDVAEYLEKTCEAVCFRNVAGQELVGNVMGSRRRLALALGITEGELLQQLRTRLRHPIPAIEVESNQAPVHEVIWEGDAVDLTKLPIHLQHTLDGAPYISATLDYLTNPETRRTNVGCRRIMPLGRAIASVDMNAPSDFRAAFLKTLAEKRPMSVAFALGSHPADFIGSQILLAESDELALIGGIRGSAVPVVRCRTIDQVVAADAEIVLEGYLDAAGYVEAEGPYGEYLGYYGRLKRNPLFHITAITMRKDALFQTVTIGGKMLGRTETAQLVALRTEAAVFAALEGAIREPLSVYALPASGGMFNVRFSMRPRYAGEVRNALAAVLACPADVKHAFAVDDDIDIFSDDQVDWALATRFQVERDLLVLSAMRAFPLDPSLHGAKLGSKAGFDLTIPFDAKGSPEFAVPDTPRLTTIGNFGSVEDALANGPKNFIDIMMAIGTRDGRDVLRSFDDLRKVGRLQRLDDGRYALADRVS